MIEKVGIDIEKVPTDLEKVYVERIEMEMIKITIDIYLDEDIYSPSNI